MKSSDIISLSNYSWNSNLSEHVTSIAKKCNPNVIVTQGGPNFPHEEKIQGGFLAERPYTDIYTILEGEKSCTNVVKSFGCREIRTKFLQTVLTAVYLLILKQKFKKY